MRHLLYKLSRKYRYINKMFCAYCSCDIPAEVKPGANMRFPHGYLGILIHPKAKIGDNVCIQHHILIGQRNGSGNVPTIGNNVVINAYSCVLGSI